MRGAVGIQGTRPTEWYYAGRDHTFFALEQDVYGGNLDALALPLLPVEVRRELGDDRLELRRVSLLPPTMIEAARRKEGRGNNDDPSVA